MRFLVRSVKYACLPPCHRRQSGFTLIETLVVTIVGIVILAAAATGVGKLYSSSEISTEAENIAQMFANLKNLKNGHNGYAELRNVTALEYKVVPPNMKVEQYQDGDRKSAVIHNSWGGLVVIYPEGANKEAFRIQYSDVPSEPCQQLSLKLRNAGWARVRAGSREIMPTSSLGDIAKFCGKDKNVLFFTSLN